MIAKFKIAIVSACLAMVMVGGQGCNDWLDVIQPNTEPFDTFWRDKEDVYAIASGAYTQFRNSIERITVWSEIRSDLVALGPAVAGNTNFTQFKNINIEKNNDHIQWAPVYNAIGRANQVIEYAPAVVSRDETFEQGDCDKIVAEMKWLRSLCYFILVRTFRDVPYVTTPYMKDDRDFANPKTDGFVILETLAAELQYMIDNNQLPFPFSGDSESPELHWQKFGRATHPAGLALLADIYLWLEKYPEAEAACDALINLDRFALAETEDWFKIFYPGNHDTESIFELQWSKQDGLDQGNQLFAWFWNTNANQARFVASTSAMAMYDSDGENIKDVRGNGATLVNNRVFKYGGTATGGNAIRDNATQNDNNWIFYRYADVLLMKAEALVMQAARDGEAYDEAKMEAAYDIVVQIRERAGLSNHPDLPRGERDALLLVLDERGREFAFEGKRWYDMVRMAVRDDGKYKNILIDLLLQYVSVGNKPLYMAKLQNTYGYFLPIHENELNNSAGVLFQNPYYR